MHISVTHCQVKAIVALLRYTEICREQLTATDVLLLTSYNKYKVLLLLSRIPLAQFAKAYQTLQYQETARADPLVQRFH